MKIFLLVINKNYTQQNLNCIKTQFSQNVRHKQNRDQEDDKFATRK